VKKNNIKYIFFESLISPKLAQTLSQETGAQALELNPLEGLTPDEIKMGKTYLTQMSQNLHNLRIALECQ
jgi:zinc transport system substrate-binding protein